MKKTRIVCLMLVLSMLVFVLASCSSKQSGDPYTYSNFTVENLVGEETTGEEPSGDGEEIFSGEVTVYSETGEITLKEVILAYCDAQNVDYTYNEDRNQFTKIEGLSANGGKFWNFSVNGKDSKLTEVVKPEDKIIISYTK